MAKNKFHLIDGKVHVNYFDVNGSAPPLEMLDLSPEQMKALATDFSGMEISYNEADGELVIKCWQNTFDDYAQYEIPFAHFIKTLLGIEEFASVHREITESYYKYNTEGVVLDGVQPNGLEFKYPIKASHHTVVGYNGLESHAQSPAKYRFDLVPLHALRAVAELQAVAVKRYGFETWKDVPLRDHYNHAIAHTLDAFLEDTSEESIEDSLTHAINRLMFIREVLHERG